MLRGPQSVAAASRTTTVVRGKNSGVGSPEQRRAVAESLEARVASLASRQSRTLRSSGTSERSWDLGDIALALRWWATCFAVISTFAPATTETRSVSRDVVGTILLVLYGVLRTVLPLRPGSGRRLYVAVALESALAAFVAFLTGGWHSPMLIMVGSALLVAGLVGGLRALVASALGALGFAALGGALAWAGVVGVGMSTIVVERAGEVAGMGAIGAYAHRIFYAGGSAYNRLRWMNEIHALLFELYGLAAEHSGLFTLDGAVGATVSRLRDVLDSDVVVLLLRPATAEGTEQPWQVAYCAGVPLGADVSERELPEALATCSATKEPVLRAHLGAGTGLALSSVTGVYAPVAVRGALIGLLALERREGPSFNDEDSDALQAVARHGGLAVDNARTYLRLRNLGAEEERERIARELHDRIGQSLAAVAFNVDRLSASLPPEAPAQLERELDALAGDVRGVNAEIREKLAELRGGPNAEVDLVRLLDGFLMRVETRSKLKVSFDHALDGRLPEVVEREIWRIACEAIRNVERHASARRLSVALRDEGVYTVVEISDDGEGIDVARTLRADAYGIVGMRERADLLGATLAFDSTPGFGTTVRLRVPRI